MENLLIENMNHLLYDFTKRSTRIVEGEPVRVRLLFLVAYSANDPEYGQSVPSKIASLEIPEGTPIYQIRHLIKFIETRLLEIFKSAYRLNIVLVQDKENKNWAPMRDIPMYRVHYVNKL